MTAENHMCHICYGIGCMLIAVFKSISVVTENFVIVYVVTAVDVKP